MRRNEGKSTFRNTFDASDEKMAPIPQSPDVEQQLYCRNLMHCATSGIDRRPLSSRIGSPYPFYICAGIAPLPMLHTHVERDELSASMTTNAFH